MICPSCGENNSANFRFCGMCGTSLEARRPAGAPRTANASDASRAYQNDAVEARMPARATVGAVQSSQPMGASVGTTGPSFLGLNQPFTDGNGNSSTGDTSYDRSHNESFSGLDSFFEQDEPGVSGRGIFLLLVLIAALGVGGWWAYTHYNGATPTPGTNAQTSVPPASPQSSGTETADNSASNAKPPEPSPSPSANSSPNPGTSTSAAQPAASAPDESANSTPPAAAEAKNEPKNEHANDKGDRNPPASTKPAERAHSSGSSHAARGQKIAHADLKPDVKPAARPAAAIPASADKGDAELKRGEAYLYGHGMPENCNEAIKNLKEASAKQSAKARSTFGTMYATGHCVPRDLTTSYSWFAQALRVDPNNQILEKDLTAVWNQMTPPERQMIAKNKQ